MKRSHDASTRTSGLRFSRLRKPWQASKSQLNRARVYTLLVVSSLLLAALFNFAPRNRVAASYTGNVIFALNNANQLLRFNAGTPGTIVSTVSVTGLQAGETLVGIDFRPANGQLYAMGVTGGSTGRLYTINTTSGTATLVGGTFALPQSAGVAAGTDYGFDFNPTVDRIRVVANSRDNFRLNPDTGTIAGADTALTAGAQIVAAGYDQNFAGTTQSSLYGIDSNTDQLVRIGGVNGSPSPNGGVVTVIGNLGVNTSNVAGLDIAVDPASVNIPSPGFVYGLLTVGGTAGLYNINLLTGAATLTGAIGSGAGIVDISVAPAGVLRFTTPTSTAVETAGLAPLTITRTGGAFGTVSVTVSTVGGSATAGQDYTATSKTITFAEGVLTQVVDVPVLNDTAIEGNETVNLSFSNYSGCGLPGPSGLLTITDDDDGSCTSWAIDINNALLRFSCDTPGTIVSQTPVTGLQPNERLVGIDFRPATGQLFALGITGGNSGRLYTLNLGTGAASLVGGNFALPQSAGVGAGTNYEIDFNPTVDRLRVVSDSRDNFRLNPDTGGIAGVDTALTPGSVVVGAAYDRNYVASPQPATTLYGIDSNTDQLVTVGGINSTPSPNTGAVTAIGNLGFNTGNVVGFDVINGAEQTAYALLSLNNLPALFTIDLATGAATPVGNTDFGFPLVDIAIAPAGTVQFSAGGYTVSEGAGVATITVTRTGGNCGSIVVTASTSNGTAAAPGDYTAVNTTLTFPEGVTTRTFAIPIVDDNVDELDEAVNLTLSANIGGRITSPATAILTIADNDLSAISINDVSIAEGTAGASNAVFTVTLSNPSSQNVAVNFATANGTAVAGSDYTATAGTVTFNPGDTSKTVPVSVLGDTLYEANETFFVNLSNAVNGAIADEQGIGLIVNDDTSFDVPGTPIPPENSVVSDQKLGSILLFPVYTSLATAPNNQNSRISITNTDTRRDVMLHLFFADGASCSVSDAYLCLTANQTTSFLTSDLDPGTTGYIVAVAVDRNGCPIIFNALMGDAYVKFSSGHAANLSAWAVSGLSGLVNLNCSPDTAQTQINFDGQMYNPLPRVLAADGLPDRASGNDTLLILDRIGGNLATSTAKLRNVFGLLFDDAENGVSFTFDPNLSQFRSTLSNAFPRTVPRYEQMIPGGRSGWMKVWSFDDVGIIGAVINANLNASSNANAFNQGHNLHIMTLTTSVSLVIPVFPPSC